MQINVQQNMKTLWTFFEKNCVDLIILLFTLRSINKQSEDHVSGKDAGLAIVVLQLAMEHIFSCKCMAPCSVIPATG